MTRTVTINGKTVTVDSGVPLAEFKIGRDTKGRPKSDFRLLLESLKPGESVFLPMTNAKGKSWTMTKVAKATGFKYAQRKERGGYRFHCLPREEAVSNGAITRRVRELVTGW